MHACSLIADTADMEASEAIVLFFGFYAVLLLYYTYVVGATCLVFSQAICIPPT